MSGLIHRADLRDHDRGRVFEVNRVVEGFTHLCLTIRSDQTRHAPDQALGLGKDRLELAVESAGHLAGKLDVRELVFTHRDEVSSGHQDVGDLHDWIGEEGNRHGPPPEVLHLRLQGRVPLKHAERQKPAEPHHELGVLRDQALDDERTLLGVQPHREPVERDLPNRLPHSRDLIRVVRDLIVGDQEIAVVGPLKPQPVLESASVVPQVQGAGWSDTGQNPLLGLRRGGDPGFGLRHVRARRQRLFFFESGARGKARRKPAVDADALNRSCIAASDDHHLIGTPHTALAPQGKH